jgi:xanthine dehydrogenase/oxidase
VLLHFPDPVTGATKTRHINSCLRPLCACDGLEVTTVEHFGSREGGMHPVQKLLAENNGTQCGLCTPGWVMAMMGLLQETPKPTPQQVEDHFDGNICRCTGYRPILDTFHSYAAHPGNPDGEGGGESAGRCAWFVLGSDSLLAMYLTYEYLPDISM